MKTQIQLRRDTASAWASANPILLAGELGIETDTNKFKFGNGTTSWSSLSYVGGGTTAVNWGDIDGDILRQEDLQSALAGKVDTVAGKGLSENDFTDALLEKVNLESFTFAYNFENLLDDNTIDIELPNLNTAKAPIITATIASAGDIDALAMYKVSFSGNAKVVYYSADETGHIGVPIIKTTMNFTTKKLTITLFSDEFPFDIVANTVIKLEIVNSDNTNMYTGIIASGLRLIAGDSDLADVPNINAGGA